MIFCSDTTFIDYQSFFSFKWWGVVRTSVLMTMIKTESKTLDFSTSNFLKMVFSTTNVIRTLFINFNSMR